MTNYERELSMITIKQMAENRIYLSFGWWHTSNGTKHTNREAALEAEIRWLKQPVGE